MLILVSTLIFILLMLNLLAIVALTSKFNKFSKEFREESWDNKNGIVREILKLDSELEKIQVLLTEFWDFWKIKNISKK